jgi:hypothetical protein
MKRKRLAINRQRSARDPLVKFQNNFHAAVKGLYRNLWNFYSWVGLFTLLYIIFK